MKKKNESKEKFKTAQEELRKKYPLTGKAIIHLIYGLIFPGLGHFLLGKKKKAYVFAASVLAFFIMGIAMNGHMYTIGEATGFLSILAVLSNMATGLPYFLAWIFGLGAGDPMSIMEPYANYFIVAAGLTNILVALDAMDIAAGRKG